MAVPPAPAGPLIALVAGEASGDLLGAHLVEALRARRPDLRFSGIAGPRMIAAGVQALYPMEKLAVRGYVEVLRRFPEIAAIRYRLKQHFLKFRPAVFIGIDAPDFNLGLEFKLKQAGITTLHYVSPSIWAWRGERIHFIKRAVDRVLNLFPFETPIYENAGIPSSYVGHPLADILSGFPAQSDVRAELGIEGSAPVIGLLPGSRRGELRNMGGLFIAAAKCIAAVVPNARFITPLANPETRALFEDTLRDNPGVEVRILDGKSHQAIAASDVVLIASGTATLEAALLQRPMVIAYRVPMLEYRWWKAKGYLPYVGLPNVLAGEFVVPELLQDAGTPESLAHAVLDLLNDAPRRQRICERFARMLIELRQDTAQKAADAVLPYLQKAVP
jgi:lipid-A-disaccharide synthase